MTSNPLTNIAVHSETPNQGKEILAFLDYLGIKTAGNENASDMQLQGYKDETCYIIENGTCGYGSLLFCREEGYRIITASEFLSTYGGKSVEAAPDLLSPLNWLYKKIGHENFMKSFPNLYSQHEIMKFMSEYAQHVTSASPSAEKATIDWDKLRKEYREESRFDDDNLRNVIDRVFDYIKRKLKEQQKQK